MTKNFSMREVLIPPHLLPGILYYPQQPSALIIVAHGSGSSRLSPRNALVAERLARKGLACLLFDLLTDEEALDRRNVFDIPLLASRVGEAVAWSGDTPTLASLPLGLFGASTGAAAALVAAALAPDRIFAIVSRGGRPDLAGVALHETRAPTLLVVGGEDGLVIDLNQAALAQLRCEAQLDIVPGATHLFEEPGTLEQVVEKALRWFLDHLPQTHVTG